MSMSLGYRSTAIVPAKVKVAILADAERVNTGRSWWCESLNFYEERKGSKHLTGDTKLYFAGSFSDDDDDDGDGLTEVDGDDDTFMGSRDATFIIQQLIRWSAEHGVGWSLEMAGVDLGTIKDGVIDPPGLFECDKPETKADQKKAIRLDKKYASRND